MSSIVGFSSDTKIPLVNIWSALDANIRANRGVNIGNEGTYVGALFQIENETPAQLYSRVAQRGELYKPEELAIHRRRLANRPFFELHTRLPVGKSVVNIMDGLGLGSTSTRNAIAGTTIFWSDVRVYGNVERTINGDLWLAMCGAITEVLEGTETGQKYTSLAAEHGQLEGYWGLAEWFDHITEKHNNDFGKGPSIPTEYYLAGLEFSADQPRFFGLQHDRNPPFRLFRAETPTDLFIASSKTGTERLINGVDGVTVLPEEVPSMSLLRNIDHKPTFHRLEG